MVLTQTWEEIFNAPQLECIKVMYKDTNGKKEAVAIINGRPMDEDVWFEIRQQLTDILGKIFDNATC
ncbi:MAG: hypothetical protein FWF81_14530 [Defluviitaleaceae bacterium]|nr:hypothetical protein [Defluviitaleaceae bacterium]